MCTVGHMRLYLCPQLFYRYYLSQKKTLEINPRHPLIKELLKRVEEDTGDDVAKSIATMMYHTGEFHQICL